MSTETKHHLLPAWVLKAIAFATLVGGGLAAANLFVGHTYLKGYVAGLGLGHHEFSLSIQEATFQTILVTQYATTNFFNFVFEILQDNWILWLTYFLCTVAIVWSRSLTQSNGSSREDDKQDSQKQQGWRRVSVGLFFSAVLTALSAALVICVPFLVLALTFLVLSPAYIIGIEQAKVDYANNVCIPLVEVRDRTGKVQGCTEFYLANEQTIVGHLVYSGSGKRIIRTNHESLVVDDAGHILMRSNVLKIPEPSKDREQSQD